VTRRQLIGFVVVLTLIAAGLLARSRLTGGGDDQLAELRRAAALQPCPAGLGSELPAVTLPCLDGGPHVTLRSAAPARPTLVNIWGSWCGPCTAEVPFLVAFAGKASGRVDVVGIDTEDDPKQALTFAKQHGMRYPNLRDDNKVILLAYGGGPPVTLLLDAQGKVRARHRGQLHSLADVEKLVADGLGVKL
jgi:thiol-disulfide isomerase/thioredoxin